MAGWIRRIIGKAKRRIWLRELDDRWWMMGGSCFGLFPPSFYYTHSKEEVSRIRQETLQELKDILRVYEIKNMVDKGV